jgi:hypothetical protein
LGLPPHCDRDLIDHCSPSGHRTSPLASRSIAYKGETGSRSGPCQTPCRSIICGLQLEVTQLDHIYAEVLNCSWFCKRIQLMCVPCSMCTGSDQRVSEGRPPPCVTTNSGRAAGVGGCIPFAGARLRRWPGREEFVSEDNPPR